ncbi:MAG TPA: extracellular solute-binding protein [Phototrophicaceae bacterium]|nr:extracellular solute-binding protein [Phototrophicaceae bacterium]
MKHRFLLVVLSALLLLAFVLPVAAQEKSLEIYITGLTEDALAWFNDVAFPAFQADHPDVKLEIQTGGWGDFDATVAGWFTTGDGPDIVYLGSEYAATYGDLLADLDPYLKDWADLEQFLPAAVETVTWDGHLRGLPLLMSPRPVFYRTDLAADASVIPPLTFADALEFVKANSAVADNAMTKMGFLDIGSGLFDAQEFIAYIWSAGGELYNEDGTSAFDSAATAEALKFMYNRRRIIMPDETTAGLPPFEGTPIASGNVVSGIFPMWNMPSTDDPLWENIAIAPYPAGENGAPLIQVFIDWLSVPAYAEDPELAVEFLKFIGSQDNAIALNAVAGYTPVRTDAWEQIKETNPVWAKLLDLAVEYGRPFSDIRASAELRPLIVEQVALYLSDQQSLEDTQQALKEEYDAILEDNGYLE